ncbi:MAG: 50S ribosomal protein L21 [Candidatus Absconditabacteria bacterium]|nr:50S ribosomal protein L21 [Candidatus Absconditabacteria bacterium]MDD3868541.1 50S ribosomal protein L21 [Candidatus Absconditabacteria bacterium]MDD4714105.1 50S ribosomal protein L21 [Candidatus Absconditabacteria bacterium]
MYAVISLQGHQYIVSEGTELVVDNLSLAEGEKLDIDQVLALFDEAGTTVKVGAPTVEGAKVEATVGTTQKGKKVQVVKFKRKNRYFRNRGFRPIETILTINKVIA